MANTVQILSSDTAGAAPVSLAAGELALNRADDELYFLDESNNIVSIVQIDCGEIVAPPEGWDISTAVFSQSLSVAVRDVAPNGLSFSPDGSRMYVVAAVNDAIDQYELSSPWDVSTASHGTRFSVLSQETAPTDIAFKSDGTRMYVVGFSGDDVNEYSLSTPWDISTATFTQNFSVADKESFPHGLAFDASGSRMYVSGVNVNEYALSSPWDISTAAFTRLLVVSAQDSQPNAIAFKANGGKLFVVGALGKDVNEYSLSTPWDISTATFTQNFSVADKEQTPLGIAFKTDGLKMYVTGNSSDSIHEYELTAV